jgi:hypothetical protein
MVMATISENLQILKDSTDAIKQAIIDKGGDVSGDITTWANVISGLSGGGSGESAEEIVFRGGKYTQATSVSYTGVLYAPNDIIRGYLVMMDYYMILRTSFCYIDGSSTDINLSINYDEPLGGTETPILLLMYSLPGDTYGQWRSQIVKIIDDGSGN